MGNLIKWFTILVVWNYFPKSEKGLSCDAIKMHSSFWETTAKTERIISTGSWTDKTRAVGSEASSPQRASAITFSAEPCVQNKSMAHEREINGNLCRWTQLKSGNSPLVYKNELAVDGTAGDKLSGLDVDVFGRLVGHVREEAAHHHQAGQVWGFLLSVTLWVQLAAQPTPHISSAVEGTVSASICGHKNK